MAEIDNYKIVIDGEVYWEGKAINYLDACNRANIKIVKGSGKPGPEPIFEVTQ